MNATLYIVATPIGNMQDISLRCAKTLFSVDYIACEDTRRAGLLLKQIEEILPIPANITNNPIKKPRLISYYEQNELQRIPQIISFLQQGSNCALISDAGTPLISDPGFKLVRECIRHEIKVESIPGPSSVIVALAVAGLPTDKFLFVGYLPKKQGQKLSLLKNITLMIRIMSMTVICFESPFRVLQSLTAIREVFGDIGIVVCRELTKIHEEVLRVSVSEAIAHFEKNKPKGEFVILFHL